MAVGAAPLIMGILLTFESAAAIVQNGLSLWAVPGFVGGCAAIVIGLGILLDWDMFNQKAIDLQRPFLGSQPPRSLSAQQSPSRRADRTNQHVRFRCRLI